MYSTPEQQNALVDYYAKVFTEKHKTRPTFNRQAGTWTFKSMLVDYTTEQIKELIDFYINVYRHPTHDLVWFGYNYDKLVTAKADRDKNREEFDRLRTESTERKRLWKERIERIKGN